MMHRRMTALAGGLALAVVLSAPGVAQQSGGVLKFYHRDSPASMSIHEEATISTVAPMMGVFNNLVLFKQDEKPGRATPRRILSGSLRAGRSRTADAADLRMAGRLRPPDRQLARGPRLGFFAER